MTTTASHPARIHYETAAPEVFAAMRALEGQVRRTGLEPALLELVRLRASQINGCAFCIDMHTRDARAAGEAERRLHLVAVWRETELFSGRERAALAWTESVTLVASTHVPDEVRELALEHFTEAELVKLTLAVIAINGWNRLAISFRQPLPSLD
jgi:AhpD family alkylhydroperoxidase